MRTFTKLLVPSFLAGGVLMPALALAQSVDVEPPLPNVLILLDSSGSMSRGMSTESFPDCSTGGAALHQTRWFAVLEALTGSVADTDIGCRSIDRTGDPFEDLYGDDTYDQGYYIPFFQMLSDGCAWIPGEDDFDKKYWEFPDDSIVTRLASNSGTDCDFAQGDGIIDRYARNVRFGLMTFDPLVDPRVQLKNDGEKIEEADGLQGGFSYWFADDDDNWREAGNPPNAGDGYAVGRPPACAEDLPMEVGARSPAAPPWEGRLMGFGHPRAKSSAVATQNERIEKVMLAMRPFGATPLAGMMSDARDFILKDDSTFKLNDGDPETKRIPLGPKDDPLWDQGDGCRPFHIVVITDGEPNLDLLPDCMNDDPGGDGVCPFPAIVESSIYAPGGRAGLDPVVNELAEDYNIVFHVIGVAISEVTDAGRASNLCADYAVGSGVPAAIARCEDPTTATPQEKTCCLLNAMAQVGGDGTNTAYYAASPEELGTALDIVLSEISAGTASRTTPCFQATSPTFHVETGSPGAAIGHEMLSSVNIEVGDGMWSGNLERLRVQCSDDGIPEYDDFEPGSGDDFGANLAQVAPERTMFTVVATDAEDSWKSLRPGMTGTDGIAVVDIQTPVGGLVSTWATNVDADALALDGGDCDDDFGDSDPEVCKSQLLRWYAGLSSTLDRDPDDSDEKREPLGAIYHSQPIIVGPPREFIRDEAYDVFATLHQARPTVVYAATIDGQIHAFLLADNTARLTTHEAVQADSPTENNELWSFVPPIVLPHLQGNVARHGLLLDGGLTAKSIVFERTQGSLASASYGTDTAYRTALVASSGRASSIKGGGYYVALDVTDPHPDTEDFDGADDSDDVTSGYRFESPKFLWQLSREGSGNVDDGPLFGSSVPPAAITSILYKKPGSLDDATEVAVAILAGGMGKDLDDDGDEDDDNNDFVTEAAYGNDSAAGLWKGGEATYRPRTKVRDWGNNRADRTVTIVRLDTGEILWRFRGQDSDPAIVDDDRTPADPVGFHAPMSGTPVPFPGLPGQVSSRVFIGDAEGMLWEIDLSKEDPEDWSMKIAWDAYHAIDPEDVEDGDVTIGAVDSVPVISVDDVGDPVVIFSTGEQETFYDVEGTYMVVSLSDAPATAGYELNWELDLHNTPDLGSEFNSGGMNWGVAGQRVTGPLNIFNGVVYFSSFVPVDDPCDVGVGRVWGVDYLRSISDTNKAPVAGWNPSGDVAGVLDYFEQQEDSIIFGVAIGQRPSCRDTDNDVIDDPVFGGYTTFTSTPPGSFELIVQTGRSRDGNNDAGDGSRKTKTDSWILPPPKSSVRIDSWASIVE